MNKMEKRHKALPSDAFLIEVNRNKQSKRSSLRYALLKASCLFFAPRLDIIISYFFICLYLRKKYISNPAKTNASTVIKSIGPYT